MNSKSMIKTICLSTLLFCATSFAENVAQVVGIINNTGQTVVPYTAKDQGALGNAARKVTIKNGQTKIFGNINNRLVGQLSFRVENDVNGYFGVFQSHTGFGYFFNPNNGHIFLEAIGNKQCSKSFPSIGTKGWDNYVCYQATYN